MSQDGSPDKDFGFMHCDKKAAVTKLEAGA
jgi:hypothetical protein